MSIIFGLLAIFCAAGGFTSIACWFVLFAIISFIFETMDRHFAAEYEELDRLEQLEAEKEEPND